MRGELLDLWTLPTALTVGKAQIPIRADFRQVLAVLRALDDDCLPLFARWRKALRLFYCSPIAPDDRQEAMEQLSAFISCGQNAAPGPRLISWDHDAHLIIAQVNQVAGREIRQEAFLHWWTFLGYFHGLGPGPFCQVLAIREKLRSGKKLDEAEQKLLHANPKMVRLPDSPRVQQEKAYLERLLKGGTDVKTTN